MGIFSRIKDAIFGHKTAAEPAPAAPAPAVDDTVVAAATPAAAAAAAPAPAPAPAPMAEVDVEAVLTEMAAQSGQPLNWRTSIVDLMKLVGMQSSLAERKELAGELGYDGDTNDSATMNIWLHKQVMAKLAENGGKVPADLLG
ncbi:MAG: DUF3597 domain-containing protein [Burkholderiales bacterium]|nr:DUF3597 family protein [Burkholderiales bacterium]MDE2505439.1 DUF3597 domain-containing protein [Burkholderiales bacterium]